MKDISHILKNEIAQIKTKLRNTCENYCNVKVPNYQKIVINNLSKHEDIIIMKQCKGSETVMMDKTKYTEKCLALLSAKQFQTLNFDPKKSTESKLQRML